TTCGCWIYSGVFSRDGVNKANSRKSRDYLGHGWGFSWPSDRRIIYNRASARPDGEPWSERKKLVWWDSGNWTGIDVPDFRKDKPPDYEPQNQERGLDGQRGDAPFILHEDGLGWLYVPKGLQDGPFPTHYEPLESPVYNPLYQRQTDPAVNWYTRAENKIAPPGDARFPYVVTTYRLTEHHTAGGMSRFLVTLVRRGWCAAVRRIISSLSRANRTSPSWKRRRSPATSYPDVCRADLSSLNGSTNTHRKPARLTCIRNNRRQARPAAQPL